MAENIFLGREVKGGIMKYLANNDVATEELISVFKSVGWNKDPQDILQAFQNSYYVTAYDEEKLVGFARAISDGYYYTSIFDMIVRPQYQKKGIAKQLMKRLLKKFQGSYFFLSYTPGNRDFYAKCGFEDLPSGMWIERGRSFKMDVDKL